MVDRGANRGLVGADIRIVEKHSSPCLVDVSGIDGHQVKDLPIVTAGGVVPSQRGPIVAIMHQYAYMGQGNTINHLNTSKMMLITNLLMCSVVFST